MPDKAQLTYSPHPLLPAADRCVNVVAIVPGETLAEFLNRAQVPLAHPLVVMVGDRLMPRETWSNVQLRSGDIVTARAALEKGNFGRLALTIGLSIVAPGIGAGIAGGLGFAAESTAFPILGSTVSYGGLFGGIVSSLGGLLISGLTAPPAPSLARASGRDQNPSPTFSLAGGSNRMRPFEPLPIVIGTHKIFPDLGARTYTEIVGTDQILYQVFNFGLSDITLSDFKIGNNPIGNFSGVTTEDSGASGTLTLFPANVDTAPGATLIEGGAWVQRTSSVNATGLAIDIGGTAYTVSQTTGNTGPAEVHLEAEYSVTGSGAWVGFFPGSSATTITQASKAPIRRGYRVNVVAGQYDVRVRVTSIAKAASITDPAKWTLVKQDAVWSQMRTYQPDQADYTGQHRYALRIRASAQLQGQIEALSAIASARCEVWTGSAWVTQATSNPAWWYRWFAKGAVDASGRRLFGGGLSDLQLDVATIQAWGAWCDTNGLTCNLVVDKPMSVVAVLRAIARCGRAVDTWASGKLGIAYDEANRPAVQVFGMGNIRAGTFSVEYLTGDLPDEIVANFINPDLDWQSDSLRVTVPGVSTPENTAVVDLFGTTDKTLAARDANLLAARQFYQPRRIAWESDFEALVCQRGDVVALSHDLTQWGYSGRLVAGTTTVLSLDRSVPFTGGLSHYVTLRFPDGTMATYPVDFVSGSSATLTISTGALPTAPDLDPNNVPVDYIWLFAPQATPGKLVKVIDFAPVDDRYIRIIAQDEDPAFYLSEFSTFTHVTPGQFTGSVPILTGLTITETLLAVADTFKTRLIVDWDVSGQYAGAFVRAGPAGSALEEVARTTTGRAQFEAPSSGDYTIEVTGFNLRGEIGDASVISTTHTILGKAAPPADVSWFVIDGLTLSWGAVSDIDLAGYRIRLHLGDRRTWGDSTPIHAGLLTTTRFTLPSLPGGVAVLLIKAVDTSGNESDGAALIAIGLGDALAANVIVSVDEHAGGFTGTIVGATVEGGSSDLIANDASGAFWSVNSDPMWTFDTDAMWDASVYTAMSYETTLTLADADAGSTLTIASTLAGDSRRIEYRRQAPEAVWSTDAEPMWTDDADPMWQTPPAYQSWPGQIDVLKEPYDIRISIDQGPTRGRISQLRFDVDVPDRIQQLSDVTIANTGTRLAIGSGWRAVTSVQLTLQSNGGSASTARTADKNASLGPLIETLTAAGALTTGLIDATVQGY